MKEEEEEEEEEEEHQGSDGDDGERMKKHSTRRSIHRYHSMDYDWSHSPFAACVYPLQVFFLSGCQRQPCMG